MALKNAQPVNNRRAAVILLAAFFLGLLFSETLPATVLGPMSSAEAVYPILRDIQYGFIIRNKTGRPVKDARFWTVAPVKLTSTQKCLELEVSQPYQLLVDDLGNQILHFQFPVLAPYETKPITIRAHLGLADIPNPVPLDKNHRFRQPEPFIESDHPEIRRLAKQLLSSTPKETAEKIFQWVSGAIRYSGYQRDTLGALYALKNRQGDCTEYMALFAALCRANGIPALGMGGYVRQESGGIEPASYHNWAEFYEGGVWNLSDPQRKVFIKNPSQYIAMRIIGPSSSNPLGEAQRFRSSHEDIEVKMLSPRGFEGI